MGDRNSPARKHGGPHGDGFTYQAASTTNAASVTFSQDVTQGAISGSNIPLTVVSAHGNFAIGGSLTVNQVTVVAASYTVDSGATADCTILLNRAGAIAITGSVAMMAKGRRTTFKDISGAANTNNITITPASGTLEGLATYVLATNMGHVTFEGDGTNAWITQ